MRASIYPPGFLEPSANPSVPRAETAVVAMPRTIEIRMEKCMSQVLSGIKVSDENTEGIVVDYNEGQ